MGKFLSVSQITDLVWIKSFVQQVLHYYLCPIVLVDSSVEDPDL